MKTENKSPSLNSPQVEFGDNYLSLGEGLSDAELSQIFKNLTQVSNNGLFYIGDFLNQVSNTKAEAYRQAYEVTHYAKGTLWNAKRTCKYLPRELRVNLSYSHHEVALGLTKTVPAIAVDFLRKAEKAGQSVKEMRQSIRLQLADGVPQVTEKHKKEDFAFVLDAFFTIRRFLENTNNSTFALKKEFVLAELETLHEAAKTVCN